MAAGYYTIKNFNTFQHKDVLLSGKWVKLYASSVDDPELAELSEQARLLWYLILAIGGQQGNKIYTDLRWLREKLHFSNLKRSSIDELITAGFLIPLSPASSAVVLAASPAAHVQAPSASVAPTPAPTLALVPDDPADSEDSPTAVQDPAVATGKTPAARMSATDRRDAALADPDFQTFWAAYPRKDARLDAGKVWSQLTAGKPLQDGVLEQMLDAIQRNISDGTWQLKKEKIRYIPLPAGWLRERRWEDEGVSQPARPATIAQYTNPDLDIQSGPIVPPPAELFEKMKRFGNSPL